MPAGDLLQGQPGPAEGVREGSERRPGEHLIQSLLVIEDCFLKYVRRGVPGMAMPESVASEFVPQSCKLFEILRLVHRPHLRLLSCKAQGHVIRSEDAISPQDRTGVEESRAGEV